MMGTFRKAFLTFLICLTALGCLKLRRQPSAFKPEPVTTGPAMLLKDMTVEEKAAQMVMVNLAGVYFPNPTDEELIRNVGVGGVYRRRWASLSRAVGYVSLLHTFAGQSRLRIPPFVAGRYTCGMGQYMDHFTGVTPLPTQMAIVATGDPQNAYLSASIAAREMRSAGINMNLAPILDVTPAEGKQRFATSRFGPDAEQVSSFAAQTIKGFQENGVLSVPGGFPGVPNVPVGGDRPLPAIIKPIQILSLTDLKPFRDAVAAGADGLAVTEVALPTVDSSGLPVMLSHNALTGILREMWGFEGLIVADAISTKVISDNFAPHDAVVKAVNAGADILLSVGGHWRHLSTIGHIVEAVRRGEISQETLDAAVLRILQLKQKYGLLDVAPPDLRSAAATCGQPASLATSSDILKHAITVLKNDGDILPLDRRRYESVLVTGVVGAERMAKILERYWRNVTYHESRAATYDRWSVQEVDITRAERLAENADLIIICTYSTERISRGQEALVRRLLLLGKPVLVVALGSPFDITFLPGIHAYIAVYGPAALPAFVTADMESIVTFMFGDSPGQPRHSGAFTANVSERTRFDVFELIRMPTGRLPLTLGERYPRGFGLEGGRARFVSAATWDFDDGTTAKGLTVEHTYQQADEYTVKVEAVSAAGNVSRFSFALAVVEKPGAQ